MGIHRLAAGLALLIILSASTSAHILVPLKRIGPGWNGNHFAWMSFVAFRPDGKEVVSDAAADPDDASGGLTFWTFPGGRLIKRWKPGLFAPFGDWTYYTTKNEIRRFRDDKVVYSLGPDDAAFAFSADSRYAALGYTGKADKDAIRVVTLPDGKLVSAFGKNAPFGVAFSPDGRLLAEGHWDFVALWDVRTGRRVATFRGLGRYVEGLSFNRRGRLLAVSSDLGTVQVWNVRRRKRIATFAVDGGEVSEPVFDPRGRYVAFGVYGTGSAFLGDLRTGRIADHQKISDLGCGSVAFSPDGRYLITPSTGGLVTWPYDIGGTIRVFRVRAR